MINELGDKVEGFETWLNKVTDAFDAKGTDRKCKLSECLLFIFGVKNEY